MFMLSVESVIRGYHEYKDIWDPAIGGLELPCKRKPGNPHDPSAVAVVKQSSGTSVVVGHVPRLISMVCSIFIRTSGRMYNVRCNWTTAVLCDLLQGGLEIRCCYIFKAIEVFEREKARKVIEGILSVAIAPIYESNSKLKKPHQTTMKQLVKPMEKF